MGQAIVDQQVGGREQRHDHCAQADGHKRGRHHLRCGSGKSMALVQLTRTQRILRAPRELGRKTKVVFSENFA